MNKLNRLLVFLFVLTISAGSNAALDIYIGEGSTGDIPITIVPFKISGSAPHNASKIIEDDLKRSGKFDVRSVPGGQQAGSSAELQAEAFKQAKITNVVVGTVSKTGSGYQIKVELVNVFGGKVVVKEVKIAVGKNFRRKTHEISNAIYKALTGIEGVFDTKIAYVRVTKKRRGVKSYALVVADFDGFDPRAVRTSPYPIMSPSWAPTGNRLAYVAFKKTGHTAIHVQNIGTGRRYVVSASKGINGAPAWSPDGSRLALTLSKVGNPEIYVFNLRSRRLRRMTVNGAIDTEATWAPDGRSIIFTSDRSGGPQLYRVGIGGGKTSRVTFSGKYNARATISPDGKKIAMVHAVGGRYSIAVKSGGETNVVTAGRLDESPNFAPNGEMLIYASEYNHRGVLFTVSADGKTKVRLSSQSGGDIREPAWGPKRK